MIRIKIVFFFFCFLSFVNDLFANSPDSIYLDLSRFLIKQGAMSSELEKEGKKNIDIFEITLKEKTLDFTNVPFGIYKFRFIGCEDCGYFVLLKHDDEYMVFQQNNLSLIIRTLIRIMDDNPNLISDNLFKLYVRALSDDEIGMYTDRLDIVKQYGKLQYIFNSHR